MSDNNGSSGEGCRRTSARQFWESQATKGTSVTQMVLCSDAEKISKQEIPELLSLLPDVTGNEVLELGSGIGRFTKQLIKKAKSVTCVDFVSAFLDVNRSNTEGCGNVAYITADVLELTRPANSCDLIFCNGLLMFLGDEDIRSLFEKALTWLKPGGNIFFAETCFSAPADCTTQSDAITYRRPDVYNSLYQSVSIPTEDGSAIYGFETVSSKSIQTYIKLKSTCNEICWLVQKVRLPVSERHGFKTFQEFLDKKQYSRTGILRYERIFGTNFVSTGGIDTTQEFVKLLKLQPAEHVLDVGAGIGGGDFYMAQTYDVFVTGIDLSANMISIALEKANSFNDPRVQFEVCDATKRNFAAATFDVVYSRDTILHIDDKRSLFASFLKWLKPGGQLLISDYCCTASEWSEPYKKYVAQRGYQLLSVPAYGKVLEEVGFVSVKAEDRTDMFVESLKKELNRINDIKDDFIAEFSEADYRDLVDGWNGKLERCAAGDQKWGLFYAKKPQ
jgi:phosphoethanolamine N-methyltransferase